MMLIIIIPCCTKEFNSSKTLLLEQNYIFLTKWGSKGDKDGQFNYPVSLTTNKLEDIYVSDSNNNCIQKFDSNGTFIKKWGSKGNTDRKFNYPLGITINPAGNVFVADFWNDCIKEFDSNGTFIKKFSNYYQINKPSRISVDPAGNIFIINGGSSIIKLDPNSNGLKEIVIDMPTLGYCKFHSIESKSMDFFYVVSEIALISGKFIDVDSMGQIIPNSYEPCILKVSLSTGNIITKWGSKGIGDGQFNNPTDIAIDSIGNIYVTDTGNNRIQKFNFNGTFITKWGSKGDKDGQFSNPCGITVDIEGNVYVADTGNYRIQKFAPVP